MNFGIDEKNVLDEIKRVEQEKAYVKIPKEQTKEKTSIKKKGWFKKKTMEEKEFKPSSTTSETLWREINLFWPETIALVIAVVAGAILMFVIRFMSATGLELIKDTMTETAYFEVAGLLQNMNTMFIAVAAIPFLVALGFYAYRFMVFTPRKNKYLVARVKREGAISLSVDAIKNMEIPFAKGMNADVMKITNPRKHWIENTGKPIVYLFEGDDSNANLNEMAGNVSSKSRDTNTVNENSIALGRRIEKYIQDKKDNFLTPMNIMLLIIMAMVGLALFFLLKNPETTAQIIGSTAPVAFMGGGI